jgi:hypothetical protein
LRSCSSFSKIEDWESPLNCLVTLLLTVLFYSSCILGIKVKKKEFNMKTGIMSEGQGSGMTRTVPACVVEGRAWQRWTAYAAVAWSLVYAALGLYWAVSGRGFPYAAELVSGPLAPVAGLFGPGVSWTIVIIAGIPAAVMGVAMLLGVRVLRPLLITAGALLSGVLLLLMTDINLLILLGYIPMGIFKLFSGDERGQAILLGWGQWTVVHQLLCLIGGFLWLAATASYARRSGDACLECGRADGADGWTSPANAARWGRIAVYVAMLVPVIYAVTRYAWVLGIPLGISMEHLRAGQESGTWISGLFLANFGLLGGVLMLGLVQHWGEVFPRWMIGLSGRRVPIALAVVPASIVSVLLMVGGISIWSGYEEMVNAALASGQDFWLVVGPTLLFPLWGAALAAATLGYYFRRRGPCRTCGRGAPDEACDP